MKVFFIGYDLFDLIDVKPEEEERTSRLESWVSSVKEFYLTHRQFVGQFHPSSSKAVKLDEITEEGSEWAEIKRVQ